MNSFTRRIKIRGLMKNGKIEKDFTTGPIFKQMLLFFLPLLLTNVLQLVFNTADIAVLGALVGDNAVAAVGSTSSLVNLLTGFFIGLAIGVNVVVSRHLGNHDEEGAKRVIGMSILLSLIFGFVLVFVGWFGSRFFLTLMKSDENVIDLSTTYLQVYFLGVPLVMLYNFLAAIMRAAGDSKRPLIYLMIGGVVNVGLNIFFVTVLKMTVEGVAIATVVAQGIAAALCLIQLLRAKGSVQLKFKYIRFYKKDLLDVLRIGVPSGIQSALFSFSNVTIQSSINQFGNVAMAGVSYAQQIEAYVYTSMNAVSVAIMTFISQNYGAKNKERIKRTILYGTILTSVVGIVLGLISAVVCQPLVGVLAENKEVVAIAFNRILIVGLPYFLCGTMEIATYSMRGLGKSFTGMIISLIGACILRVIWVSVVNAISPNITLIYLSYPVSWIVTTAVGFAVLLPMVKKLTFEAEEK
ncbi:MAG: MATE family efflux transporter [Clostridiales bacterium]|nr:MATE family efflux transporter [Clostridiales bacterium]